MMMKNICLTCLLFCVIGSLDQAKAQKRLRIMSYNIHHGQDSYDKDQLKQMAELIKRENADIVGLQEVDSFCPRSGKIDQAKTLAELTGMHYSFTRHFAFEGGAYGVALLSRYPITSLVNNRLPVTSEANGSTVSFLTAELSISREKKIVVGVAHLDYRSSPSRVNQAKMVAALFSETKRPIILMGDMNAEPQTEEIAVILKDFKDTQSETQLTFPTLKPEKKIDYIFTDRMHRLKIIEGKVLPDQHSDHLAIVSSIEL